MPKMYKSYGAIFSLTVTAIGHGYIASSLFIPCEPAIQESHVTIYTFCSPCEYRGVLCITISDNSIYIIAISLSHNVILPLVCTGSLFIVYTIILCHV